MKINIEKILAYLLLGLLFTMVFITFFSCGTRKKESRTKVEAVSVIKKNQNIKKTETKINTVQLLDVSKLKISFNPINEAEPMQFIKGTDTITTFNASVQFNSEIDKTKIDKTEKKTENQQSKSTKETQKNIVENQRTTERKEKKGNPWNWVAIIFSLAVVAFVYFKWPVILNKLKNAFI